MIDTGLAGVAAHEALLAAASREDHRINHVHVKRTVLLFRIEVLVSPLECRRCFALGGAWTHDCGVLLL